MFCVGRNDDGGSFESERPPEASMPEFEVVYNSISTLWKVGCSKMAESTNSMYVVKWNKIHFKYKCIFLPFSQRNQIKTN